MAIFSQYQKHPACFFFSLFPSVFAANKIFFSIFFGRDLLSGRSTFSSMSRGGVSQQRKGKKRKNTQHARARKEGNEEVIKPAAMYSILFFSLSLSLRVCIFYYNKARAKNGFNLYILRVCGNDASQLFNCRDQKSIGPRSLGVKLAPGSKIKKATAMHAKANVALDSSTSVTSSLGA